MKRASFPGVSLLVCVCILAWPVQAEAGPFAYIPFNADARVGVLDTAINEWTTIDVGGGPTAVAVNPVLPRVYVVNSSDGSVSVIDSSMNEVIATIPVGLTPTRLIVTNDGSTAYVANTGDATVSVIDTTANTVFHTIVLEGDLTALSLNPSGTRLYVAQPVAGHVWVINTVTMLQVADVCVAPPPVSASARSLWTQQGAPCMWDLHRAGALEWLT